MLNKVSKLVKENLNPIKDSMGALLKKVSDKAMNPTLDTKPKTSILPSNIDRKLPLQKDDDENIPYKRR